jgi:protocatechuate 3,4-dioxygenase, beta subunit
MTFEDDRAPEISLSRRAIIASGLGLLLANALPVEGQAQGRTRPTPALPAGPNYPDRWQAQPLGDLVVGPLAGDSTPFTLAGRVVDTGGVPIVGARVELWQCDGLGQYHHDNHSRPNHRDKGLVAFGWQRADDNGLFAIRTIKAIPCEDRAPHFHISVKAMGRRQLITQIFVPDHPENAGDIIYRRMARADRETVTAVLRNAGGSESGLVTIVLS